MIDQPNQDEKFKKRIFKYFNWQNSDFSIDLLSIIGKTTVFYSRTGQSNYENNIYSAVPLYKENSLGTIEADDRES